MNAYPIPAEALDDRLGIVGTSGAGKTYTAMGAVERLLASGARCVIVDPLDVWWGLRLSSDGDRASKFKLPILGGSHGDLPLTENSGALIGETVAGMADSCIVSLGGFSSGAAERRFMLAFLSALYRRSSGALFHLVLDEADLWAPQQVFDKEGGTMQLKGIVENIVRRGRVKGFVPWLITQRPAVIDKSIMSMMVGLIAMKAMSPQDREAILAWLKGQMAPEQRAELDTAMPQLNVGEGIVWLPGHGVLQRAQFPAKATFDSSRAPRRGEAAPDRELKPLDLGVLQERLSAVEAEVKANDPKALKAEIARLRAETAQSPGVDLEAVSEAEHRGYRRGKIDGYTDGVQTARATIAPVIEVLPGIDAALASIRSAVAAMDQYEGVQAKGPPASPTDAPAPARPPPTPREAPTLPAPRSNTSSVQQRVLDALGELDAIGVTTPPREFVAMLAGYSNVTSKGFREAIAELRNEGAITIPADGRLSIGEPGRARAAPVAAPMTGGELRAKLIAILGSPVDRILVALTEAYPAAVPRTDLAAAVGYTNVTSKGFREAIARLRDMGFIEAGDGEIRAASTLFPGGR